MTLRWTILLARFSSWCSGVQVLGGWGLVRETPDRAEDRDLANGTPAARWSGSFRILNLALMTEALALGLLRLAADVRFDWFAFFDGGAELAIHALMRRGLRPRIDFGTIYGLLPLLIGEGWYGLFGLRPGAFAAASILGGVLTAWGLGRALTSLRVGVVGVTWVVVAMPIGLISAAAPSLTHVLEPILLIHAMADLAAGRRARALALASACVFVKPSMAYLLGAAILIVILVRDRPSAWTRNLWPSVAVAAILATVLGGVFGPRVLVNSVLPIAGRAVYRENGFGFFTGSGRAFWLPDRANLTFYVHSLAGPWLIAFLMLSLAGLSQISRSGRAHAAREDRIAEGAEVVILCAVLHAAFVALFFGNAWSWVYYYPMLVLGLAASSARSRRGALCVLILTAMFAPSCWRSMRGPIEAWTGRARSVETYGLWASESVRGEWREVGRRIAGRRAAILSKCDGAALLDARFTPPTVAYLVRGHVLPAEIARKRASLRAAEFVVVANPDPGDPWFDDWPEFAAELREFDREWSCSRLRLYARAAGAESRISSKKSR